VDINALKDIEDRLMAGLKLDAYERSLYYHLARHTRAEGKESALFSIARLATRLGMSDTAVRDRIRSMDQKGCIKVEERSKNGHQIRVLLPEEIQGLSDTVVPEVPVDIEAIDFYSDRRWADAFLKREGSRCFYCLLELRSNWVLDHVVPRVNGGTNSFRNVVVSCHECNAAKQASSAEDFLRSLRRRGILRSPEFDARKLALERLKSGCIVPEM
jgi:DNA-binding Lrp family transcriptional regulator